ncbi:glycerophosphoryl diester phosphodiesterase [Hydrogenispora ethanolica]|uniref:Glycerophosphoryl diester phosphodiesterase n=1 Tax=Hydrogenispora ethanolica TaxID=1082276 RepID=A0A4R1S7D9_HYDET|nr:glycerophosphodiester phosphodiesterase family protein [Hydrogenispora ethanolica]TCL75159.1 glycerophosphoryl diester phosphodiesterase [Hydrogenispora ethanolica]
MSKRSVRRIALIVLGFSVLVYLNNSSWTARPRAVRPWLLAHRGLAQTFHTEGLTNETCTARRIDPPEHPYLENTIPSMAAAFAAGADVVELDIQPTRDGWWAVFHDWTLDCRTDGQGVTREHTLAELKALDIGYGYTADNGKTYPFRGKGIGLLPTLPEVLARFPERAFLIHIKSNDPAEGRLLARYLKTLPPPRRARLAVYGGDQPIAALQRGLPELRVMSRASLIRSLLSYMALGWTGYVPAACRDTEIHLPVKFAHWLWGWPNRFLERMAAANTRVIVVAGSGEFSEGFDTPESLKQLPPDYWGGIWTNRIDCIAPLFRTGKRGMAGGRSASR